MIDIEMTSQIQRERPCSKIIDAQVSFFNDESLAETFSEDQRFDRKVTVKIPGLWKLNNDTLEKCSKDGVAAGATYSKIRKFYRNQHDKRWFCLECGMQEDKFYIFLMIPHSKDGDEWEDELCKITDQSTSNIHHDFKRVRSYHSPSQTNTEVSRKRAQSEYSTSGGFKAEESNGCGDSLHSINDKEQDDTQTNTNNTTEDENPSPPCSLKSYIPRNDPSVLDVPTNFNILRTLWEERDQQSVSKEFVKTDLEGKLKLAEFSGKVYVVGWDHAYPCDSIPLLTGDCICQVNKQLVNNVSNACDFILTTAIKEVKLVLERSPLGTVVAVPVTSFEDLGIELKGSEIQMMDPQRPMRAHCDPLQVCFKGERSKRSITAIGVTGNQQVPFDASTEEVKRMLKDSIEQIMSRGMEEPLVLHLHPTAFLKELRQSEMLVTVLPNHPNTYHKRRRQSDLPSVDEADEYTTEVGQNHIGDAKIDAS